MTTISSRPSIRFAASAIAMSLIISACGGKDSSSGENRNPPKTSPVASPVFPGISNEGGTSPAQPNWQTPPVSSSRQPIDNGQGSADGGQGPIDGGQGPIDGGQADGAQSGGLPIPLATPELDYDLKLKFQQYGVRPVASSDFLSGSAAEVELGRALFFDTVLSGNRNTSCASCHMPERATSNAVSLGGTLQALENPNAPKTVRDLLPRNSPALFNRGHKSYTQLFWDSRVRRSETGFVTPAGAELPAGLSGPLAAQALFPLISREEMLGCVNQNEVADAAQSGRPAAWAAIVQRIKGIPGYQTLLRNAYPNIAMQNIGIQHIANALATFQSVAWKSVGSPFDRYLVGDSYALTPSQKVGAQIFYGKGNCASCHSGPLQTDQHHHAIGMPQFGPGVSGHEVAPGVNGDRGWGNYKFRTPSLRNVILTAPYGHDGAYKTIEGMVGHYVNPKVAMSDWERSQVVMPFTLASITGLWGAFDVASNRQAVANAVEASPVALSRDEIAYIVDFLRTLTDPNAAKAATQIPASVPSGLTVGGLRRGALGAGQ